MHSVLNTISSFKSEIQSHLPMIIWLTVGPFIAVVSGLILAILMPPYIPKSWRQMFRTIPQHTSKWTIYCLSSLIVGLGMMVSGIIAHINDYIMFFKLDRLFLAFFVTFLLAYLLYAIASITTLCQRDR